MCIYIYIYYVDLCIYENSIDVDIHKPINILEHNFTGCLPTVVIEGKM